MLLRNEALIKNINGLFYEEHGFRNDLSLNQLIQILKSKGSGFNLTVGLTLMPVKNITKHKFILPSKWIIGVLSVKNKSTLFLPLTPEIGIIYTNDEEFVLQAKSAKIMYLQDEILADWFNNSLIGSEIVSSDNGYIIGGEEEILSVIKRR